MSLSQDQVVDYIKNLKLGEVKALIETLEKELGVSASAPVAAVSNNVGPGPAPAVEKTEFDVIMTAYPAESKINVIKVVREITALGLKEAKALVEGLPAKIKEAVQKDEANKIKDTLVAAGATVDVK
jgi:large subunit ribosomal protein L7/L12